MDAAIRWPALLELVTLNRTEPIASKMFKFILQIIFVLLLEPRVTSLTEGL